MVTVTGRNRRPMFAPPGPVAVPLSTSVAAPGAIASNNTAPSRPVPVAPVASADRIIVMSTRPLLVCCVNVAFAPPDRMKLPSLTTRTRSKAGLYVNVSVIDDSRLASVIEIGTVYGPPPTRNVVPGGDRITCAEPMPGVVVGSAGGVAACAGAAAGGASAAAGGVAVPAGGVPAVPGGGGAGAGVGAGTTTVPGTGVDPGGDPSVVPLGGDGWPVGTAPGALAGERAVDPLGVPAAFPPAGSVVSPPAMSGGGPPMP